MAPREATRALRKRTPLLRLPRVNSKATKEGDASVESVPSVLTDDLRYHDWQWARTIDGAGGLLVKASDGEDSARSKEKVQFLQDLRLQKGGIDAAEHHVVGRRSCARWLETTATEDGEGGRLLFETGKVGVLASEQKAAAALSKGAHC